MIAYPPFYQALTGGEILRAWLIGLRFDFATALLTITIPFLILWFPLPRKWYPVVIKLVCILSILMIVVVASFLWGDDIYYSEAGHHATFEVKGMSNDLFTMFILLLTEYTFLSIGLILFWIFLGWLVWRLFRPLRNPDTIRLPQTIGGKILVPIVIIFITLFGIRGGFQLKPMRIAFAFRGDNILAGHLALNGWYTVITTAFANDAKLVELMPAKEAYAKVQRLLRVKGDTFLDDRYPLYRESGAPSPIARPDEKLNVVLIVVESLTAEYLGSFGGSVDAMPFLDSLANQSVRFDNCYSIGTRSMEGLSAVLASIPNLMGTPFMGSKQEQTKVLGIGTVFRSAGYTARFIHGAKPGSMNIEQIGMIAGYEKFYTEDDFPKEQSDDHWGIWDRYTLQRMSKEMDTLREPYHMGMFTLSSHHPFLLPPEFKPPFPKTVNRYDLYNSFANLDVEFRKFFAYESKQPRFNHTIYVIIGDHTSMIEPEEGVNKRFRIGCMIYAPGRLAPAVNYEPASQLDIEPTLIHLCGLKVRHASFGHSLFDSTDVHGFAYFTQSGLVAWRDNKRLLVSDLEHDIGLYNPIEDPFTKNNLLHIELTTADTMRQNLFAFYETAEKLLYQNRVVPLIESTRK